MDSLVQKLSGGGFEIDQLATSGFTVDRNLNSNDDPIFKIPSIEFPCDYPDGLREGCREKYRYQVRQYMLLDHLWTVQLRNPQHRHYWNIRAAYDFWRQHGPKTFDGRYYAWSTTWITDAMDRIRADINKMMNVGRALTHRDATRAKLDNFQKQFRAQIAQAMPGPEVPTNSMANDRIQDYSHLSLEGRAAGNAFRGRLPRRQQENHRVSIKPPSSRYNGELLLLDSKELIAQLGRFYSLQSQNKNRRIAFSCPSSSYSVGTSERDGHPQIHNEGSPSFNLHEELNDELRIFELGS